MLKVTIIANPAQPKVVVATPGPLGQRIYSGTGAPADTLGNEGDFYLDLTDRALYGPKAPAVAETVWPLVGRLNP